MGVNLSMSGPNQPPGPPGGVTPWSSIAFTLGLARLGTLAAKGKAGNLPEGRWWWDVRAE